MNIEADESLDPEQLEFDKEEAQLVLKVARAHHTTCWLEQELAQSRCSEGTAITNLYKYQAEEAGRKLASAEYDIGRIHNTLHTNSVIPPEETSSPCKLKHRHEYSSPSVEHLSSADFAKHYTGMCIFVVLCSLH